MSKLSNEDSGSATRLESIVAKKANYYDILHVSPGADAEVIRAAYKALAKKYHPDQNSRSPQAESVMRSINEAYETLRDPHLRAKYDNLCPTVAPADQARGKRASGEAPSRGAEARRKRMAEEAERRRAREAERQRAREAERRMAENAQWKHAEARRQRLAEEAERQRAEEAERQRAREAERRAAERAQWKHAEARRQRLAGDTQRQRAKDGETLLAWVRRLDQGLSIEQVRELLGDPPGE